VARLFDKYHPERHYMRGPGPRCLERQGDASVFPKIWRCSLLSTLKTCLHLEPATILVAPNSPHDLGALKWARSG
jgi:hypothetical protein